MALDVLDERGQQGMGAVQLPGENTVRMGGGDRAHGIREQAAHCIDFREDVTGVRDEGGVAPEATDISLVRRHQSSNGIGRRHRV